MTEYRFVTKSHLTEDEIQSVEILTRSEVAGIANNSAEQVWGLLKKEFAHERDRLTKHIDKVAKKADEAVRAAAEAQEATETTANRLVKESRSVFREIVEKSLQPILNSGLKQVLDKQKNIEAEHKSLRPLRTEFEAVRQTTETQLADLAKESQRLQEEIVLHRQETGAAQELGEKRLDNLSFETRALRSELGSLCRVTDVLRKDSEESFCAMEAEKLRVQGELDALHGDAVAARDASGKRLDRLTKENQELKERFERLRTTFAEAKETDDERWKALEAANNRSQGELAALRGELTEEREVADRTLAGVLGVRKEIETIRSATEASKQSTGARLEALESGQVQLQGELDALQLDSHAARQTTDEKLVNLEEEILHFRDELESLKTEMMMARQAAEKHLTDVWKEECRMLRADTMTLRRRFALAAALLLAGMISMGGVLWGQMHAPPSVVSPGDGASAKDTTSMLSRGNIGKNATQKAIGASPDQVAHPVTDDAENEIDISLASARAGEKEAQVRMGKMILAGRVMDISEGEASRWVLMAGLNGAEEAGNWMISQALGGNKTALSFFEKARQGDTRALHVLEKLGVQDCMATVFHSDSNPQATTSNGKSFP